MTDEEEAKYEEQQKKKSNPAWWEGRVESIATEFEELATSDSLSLSHWKILTGSDEETDSRYEHLEEGIFPRECDEYFLSLLTAEERGWIALSTQRDPLRFPCTPQQLLAFVDADPMGGFDVPDAFRSEVERLAEVVDQLAEKRPAESVTPTSLGATDMDTLPVEEKRKRAALINELLPIWPSIERDLRDASRNGLQQARRPESGAWAVVAALEWAKTKGKTTKVDAQKFVKSNDDSELTAMLRQLFHI